MHFMAPFVILSMTANPIAAGINKKGLIIATVIMTDTDRRMP